MTQVNPIPSMSAEAMQSYTSFAPNYRAPGEAAAMAHQDAVLAFWNMKLIPMLSNASTGGRFSGAALACPVRSCIGMAELAGVAVSNPYRNPDAIENIVCIEGSIAVEFGDGYAERIELERFDMLSLPANVRHRFRNLGGATAKFILALNAGPDSAYPAVFDAASVSDQASESALSALSVTADHDPGATVNVAGLESRLTRFKKLVPYKKGLSKSIGIPPEATEMLSAGSVFPLIVPEGHVGRSQTAPMFGYGGLYISIAECLAGDDGPPPHAHSDTQENFFVLDGSWDITTGFDNEYSVAAKPGDLFAIPPHVMRAFQNTSSDKARLLVLIQGPERMNDHVSYSASLGKVVEERFGPDTIEAYKKIKMSFDAEERLKAAVQAAGV